MRTLLAVAFSVAVATPAVAQQPLKLDFHNGLVTVDASGVTVRTILTEWGRLGGTKIVGADRVSGAPLTLKLVDVSEAKALETILRSVAGYMAAPRTAAGAGPSIYDRILVMATTTAPAPVAAARPQPNQPNNAFNGTQRFIPPRQREAQPEQDEQEEPDENPPNPPVFTFPQPGQQSGFGQPGQFNNPGPAATAVRGNPSQPQNITITPATSPGQPTMPGGPIGVSTPGMMVNPPQQQPNQPGVMIRPPGRQQQQ